jgi:Transglutaminase-like superfamily
MSSMTDPGRFSSLFGALPRGVDALRAVAHGLILHEHLAPAYGVVLSDADRATVHLRRVESLLAAIRAHNPRPLAEPRPASERVAGNCRHFTVLTVAMLRAQGIAARARCGFGDYFGSGAFEDHWVVEYRANGGWLLADAQIDARQRELFPIDFDLSDVPRDRFLVAGDAWARCRAGTADPARFGLAATAEYGLWWVAGNLMRDAAALLGRELLPWDVWGAMPEPGVDIPTDLAALFDKLAGATADPDGGAADLRRLCSDDRLRVPDTVLNAVRDQREPI